MKIKCIDNTYCKSFEMGQIIEVEADNIYSQYYRTEKGLLDKEYFIQIKEDGKPHVEYQPTLLDQLAIGFLSNTNIGTNRNKIVREAYLTANLMLEERKKYANKLEK